MTETDLLKEAEEVSKGFLDGKKTIIGLLIVIAPVVSKVLGYEINEAFPVEIAYWGDTLVIVLGFLIALVGRLKAKGPVRLFSK